MSGRADTVRRQERAQINHESRADSPRFNVRYFRQPIKCPGSLSAGVLPQRRRLSMASDNALASHGLDR
jgi:hypothetical protein